MDIGTIIIAIVFILLGTIPFLMMRRSNNKRANQLLNSLVEIASHYKSKISLHDSWHNAAIGMDESTNIVFFTKKVNDSSIIQEVDLHDILECQINNVDRSTNDKDFHHKTTDRLELRFKNKESSRPDIIFVLYDVSIDRISIAGEIQLVNKWCQIINEKLKGIGMK